MTHEHLDHVQGLFFSAKTFNKRIHAKQAWLTGSADPQYYTGTPTRGEEAEDRRAGGDAAASAPG